MPDCMYCAKDVRLHELMRQVVQLPSSTMYLHTEQSYPGRCILVYRQHKHKLTDLTEEEYGAFFADVRRCAKVLEQVYHPDKINYLVLGDVSPHLHLHLVPKYQEGCEWGEIFQMLPSPGKHISEEELRKKITTLQKAFEAQ